MKKILTFAILLAGFSLYAAEPAAEPAAKAKPFPESIKTCLVSGEKLGEMGKPYVFVYEGQEVKLCCMDCLKKFDKEPAKYLAKINAAATAAPAPK